MPGPQDDKPPKRKSEDVKAGFGPLVGAGWKDCREYSTAATSDIMIYMYIFM